MAKNKKEILSKDVNELRGDLRKAQADLLDLRLDHSQFKLKNTRQIFTKRKDSNRLIIFFKIF